MKILIIDDSRVMRLIVARNIRLAGFDDVIVIEAANGKEGLDSIEEAKPDAVLCDWNMPEMSGLQLLRVVKDRQISVKIGVITSDSSPETHSQALEAGALFVLTKPFEADEFKEALNGVLH